MKNSEEPNKKAETKELETRKRKLKAHLNSHNKKCKLPLSTSKKENLETTLGPKLKTSKGATRRQKMMREIFNDVIMCKDITQMH